MEFKYLKSTKVVFNVQGVWQSQNMLPTMVHGQAFRIATRQPSILSAYGDVQGRSVCGALETVIRTHHQFVNLQ